jgi:hypothetical protein
MFYYFKKKLYQEFYKNISEQFLQKKAVFFIEESIDKITFHILLGNKHLKMVKIKNEDIQLSLYQYDKNQEKISQEFYLWMKQIKYKGFVIDNNSYVEKIYELFNKIKVEYKINLKEQKRIWSFIFLNTNNFFDNHIIMKTKNLIEEKSEQYID